MSRTAAQSAEGGREPRDGPGLDEKTTHRALEETWGTPKGLYHWLASVDHKVVGRRYLLTAFVFFVLGGIQALLMRLQLAAPDNELISADRYNQIFTMHGTTMMFLFAVPVMEAMAVYLVPLMVGMHMITNLASRFHQSGHR
jgi:cytochrome c oxidase subunit 1